ncbi:39S ribosomal protein L38, mitochondrial isoform X2 [Kryptolebias marmoratus]|uniref:39S ribosomal protein L38, mitochondrial isoform X2 n=1 Tax=Kryptolebias marmoratus TaxID=37003 RepID=UPI0007F88627|nr:39S ribosomal protein L38, mitochondrial isoform X2 [Kryptolebias marmoratus]
MALRTFRFFALRPGLDLWAGNARTFVATAFLRKWLPPLGPMPNEEFDVSDLESLEKYRSYNRYFKQAEEAKNKAVWWKTYRSHVKKADPEHGAELVDIGLPYCQPSRTKKAKERRQLLKDNKRSAELERTSRLRTFKIPLDRVQDEWEKTSRHFHVKRLADHYGVFRDLFPKAYFLPHVTLCIGYSQDKGSQVHFGNRLTPTEAASAPQISFDAEEDSLWTLLLTSPDEHLLDDEAEYVHWLVGNIPGGAVQDGEELCHYLPPFPARGTGFHRYVYVLFKQDRPINFLEDVRPAPWKHQEDMTPAGLAFFQSQWDPSVTNTFHDTLNMKEPVFEFIRPPVYHPPQVKFPHGKPLRYLDRYRDGKEHTYGIY